MKRSEKIAMLQIRFVIIFSDFISFHFFLVFLPSECMGERERILKINCNLQHGYCCDRIIKTLRMIQGKKKDLTKNIQIIS